MNCTSIHAPRRVLALLLCLCMLLPCVLTAFAVEDTWTAADEDNTITLEYQELPEEYQPWLFAAVTPLTEISENAIELKYGEGEHITGVKLYYKSGNNWIDITEAEDRAHLPADAELQFEFTYSNISVDELINKNGQMVYRDLPDWFQPSGKGVLLYDGKVVAQIEVIDGAVVVTFDPDWLESNKGKVLNGTLKVSGQVDWRQIPEEGVGQIPGIDASWGFEDNLAQKYGIVTLDKTAPVLERGEDGKYYLKYTLTVTNEDTVTIPEVRVRDMFATAAYIERYVNVTGRTLPNADTNDRSPWEDGAVGPAGTLSGDINGMLWNIGALQPGETRTLTYYAQIADDYVSNIINNPIVNRADVYSGDILKDTDAASFTPTNSVRLGKSRQETSIGPDGSGTITYAVTITADEANSFVMDNLTLTDIVPEELWPFLSGDESNGARIGITATKEPQGESKEQTVDYANGSFTLSDLGLDLAPGETITLTYTLRVRNIFLASSEQIELTNTATVSKGGRTLSSNQDTLTLDKQTWTRKIAGDPLDEKKDIPMEMTDAVYQYVNGTASVVENPGSFEVPKGSIEYQVILNEGGQWGLSSSTMTDRFDSDFLKYVGYVQIQLFDRGENAREGLSDQALTGELENAEPVKTVWLKVDGDGTFSFHPEDLGLDDGDGKYTYLLTYYAQPTGMENVGSVQITNHFSVKGTVGVGNGSYVELPGVELSVGKVVQGGVNYNAEKTSWYYEPDPAENGTVDIWTSGSKYENGALYWIIRLEGTIPKGLIVRDVATSGNMVFCYDSIPVVYRGPKSLDLTSYSSFGALLYDNDNGLEALAGRKYNGRWYQEIPSNAVYDWQLEDTGTVGPLRVTFLEKIELGEDEAVYIVIRTNPSTAMPTAKNSPRIFNNDLYVGQGSQTAKVDDAEYRYVITSALGKESKGAYIFDKEQGTFTNCSDRNTAANTDWRPENLVRKDLLESSGIYAAWLLNINYNGSMSGTYDVIDHLPAGMELVYVDVNNFGNGVRTNMDTWPKTVYVQEWSADPAWREMEYTSEVLMGGSNRGNATAITYYNDSTGEIRWRISNFTSATGSDDTRREINLRIICRVSDPELFLNQVKTYENTADLLDPLTNDPDDIVERENADVTITMKLGKDWDVAALEAIGGLKSDGTVNWPLSVNQLPFAIDVNPFAEDLCDGETLPALIDLLSNLELIEGSIAVTILDGTEEGTPYTDFTYDVDTIDGQQALVISGLPDSKHLKITYKARIIAAPNEETPISNTAYWAGYDVPDEPQVKGKGSYQPEGDVFTNEAITVTITKVDADSHSKCLNGAVFALYEVDEDGALKGEAIRTGTSNSLGNVIFDNKDGTLEGLKFDTVYCIKETTAPNGYELDLENNCYYFVIVKYDKSFTKEGFLAIKEKYEKLEADYKAKGLDLDVWYDSPEYSVVIENTKGSISVKKIFIGLDGEKFEPTSGTYRFGLFDLYDNLLETLTIEYTGDDPNYYLDGVPKDSPRFTQYDPEGVYQIYELDANGAPIKESGGEYDVVYINGVYYRVTYGTLPDHVTIGSEVEITNTVTELPRMPGTGGPGLTGYYTAVGMLLLLFWCFGLLMRSHELKRE